VLKERVFFAGGHIAIRGRWKLEQAAKKENHSRAKSLKGK